MRASELGEMKYAREVLAALFSHGKCEIEFEWDFISLEN